MMDLRVTWSQSGKGHVPLQIEDVRQLAIASGFIFDGECDLAKRANLGGSAVISILQSHEMSVLNAKTIHVEPLR